MPKQQQQALSPKIVAIGADGKRSRIKAERLEIEIGDGRRLLLGFPPQGWGELEIEAETADEAEVPVVSVQASACNVLTLRVDVHRDLLPVESFSLPEQAMPPALALTVQKALDGVDKAAAPKKHLFRRWAQAALLRDAEVTIRLVGEDEGRTLNRDFRGKDYATNVLTFVYGEEGEAGVPLFGDLVLCVPVVLREAAAQGKTVDAHFAHLVVHGMLHLQGHDHENDREAETMEDLERGILKRLGYADPYATERA